MTNKINCLDHGFVKLLNISSAIPRDVEYEEINTDGTEEGVDIVQTFSASDIDPAICARISFDNFEAERTEEMDLRLVEYLIKNSHNTPIEMTEVWLEMKLPIFVARQFVRHRTACLVGDTKLIFERPCDRKAYSYRLDKFVKNWLDNSQRSKLKTMGLRMVDSSGNIITTKVIDAWVSGVKECFRLVLEDGSHIEGSADHRFKTQEGYKAIQDLCVGDILYSVKAKGAIVKQEYPHYSEEELSSEEWVEFLDGFEVSSLGRIKSWYKQGSKFKQSHSTIKLPTLPINTRAKTALISAKGKTYGVGRLVAENFIGTRDKDVLHKDDNVLNNRITNLYYGDDTDNKQDSIKNDSIAKLREIPLKLINIYSVGMKQTYDINVAHEEHNFLANHIVTHNCINEVSARYVQLPEEWYIPEVVGGKSISGAKQGQEDNIPLLVQERFKATLNEMCKEGYTLYNFELSQGVAPEHARLFLHVNHYTHWLWKQDLHNLMHFLALRLDSHAQVEARVYAQAVYDLLSLQLPKTMELFDKYRRLS